MKQEILQMVILGIGSFITTTLNIFPPLIGFGIPQRTPNYILGKPLNPP